MPIAYDQEVQLKISTQTDGGVEVESLADQIEALGRQAGTAEPQFVELASALRQMGKEGAALETFKQLKFETGRLAKELDGASAAVDKLSAELDASKQSTRQAVQVQQDSAAKVGQTKERYDQLKIALQGAQNELRALQVRSKEAGAASSEFSGQLEAAKSKVDGFKGQLGAVRTELRAYEADRKTATQEVRTAQQAERDLERQYDKSVLAAKNLSGALGEETARLSAARSVLAAAGIDTTKLADAQSKLTTEIQKGKTAAQDLAEKTRVSAAAADAAGKSFNSAFGVIGIRSAASIKAEILQVNQAVQHLAISGRVSGDEFARAYAAAQAKVAVLSAELRTASTTADGFGKKIKAQFEGMQGSIKAVGLAIAALGTGREFIRVNVAIEALERGLTQIMGSARLAAKEIEWLKTTANRLGVETISASRAYMSLAAAAKNTAMEGEGVRKIFEAVAGSMAKLGKSSAETEGALQAITQMMGKGVVSMEEMRQQLAERLPGAMQATADSAGVTVQELTAMIATGQVLAVDLLPHLTAGLEKMYGTSGKIEGTVGSWNRFKNALNDTFEFIGKSKVMEGLTSFVEFLAFAVRGVTAGFEMMGITIGNLAGLLVDAFENPKGAIDRFIAAQNEAADTLKKRLQGTEQAAEAEKKLIKETKESAAATLQKIEAEEKSAESWLSLSAAYTKASESAEKATTIAVKSAAARTEEGRATLNLINAMGSEADKRWAAIEISKNNATALTEVAVAREKEARLAQNQADKMVALARAQGDETDARRKAIKEIQDKADALQAEAEKSAASALAAQQHTAILEAQSAAIQDNSSRMFELRGAAVQAAEALDSMKKAFAAGKASQDELNAATQAAARANYLYRDSLRDVIDAISRKAAAVRSANTLEQANVNLALQQIRNAIQIAEVEGNTTEVIRLKNQAVQLEIELGLLKAEALRAEAKAQFELIKAKRAELEATGELTAAKKAELDAMEAAAKIKGVEADIAENAAHHTARLAEATERAAKAAKEGSWGFGKMADDMDRLANSSNSAANALNRVNSSSSQSNSYQGYNTSNQDNGIGFNAEAVGFREGVSIDDISKFAERLHAEMQKEMAKNNFGAPAQERAIAAAKAYIHREKQKEKEGDQSSGDGSGRKAVYEIRFTLPNNQSQSISVGSKQEAEGLVSMFKNLEDSARRSAPV